VITPELKIHIRQCINDLQKENLTESGRFDREMHILGGIPVLWFSARRALMQFGSIDAIKHSSVKELKSVRSIGDKKAEMLLDILGSIQTGQAAPKDKSEATGKEADSTQVRAGELLGTIKNQVKLLRRQSPKDLVFENKFAKLQKNLDTLEDLLRPTNTEK
jgi:hypothetical protein